MSRVCTAARDDGGYHPPAAPDQCPEKTTRLKPSKVRDRARDQGLVRITTGS